MESTLEKLKTTIKDNQNTLLLAGAVAGTAALGYLGYKTLVHPSSSSENGGFKDQFFDTQNLALYHSEAIVRDKLISNVSYDLVMNLQAKESKRYSGRLLVQFVLSQTDNPDDLNQLFLDFQGESISFLKINGKEVTRPTFSKHRIYLPAEYLEENKMNLVTFKFVNTYVDNSAGLHKHQDPKDQEFYVYSHLEPYFCHRWMPCFDQPSLRSVLRMTVIAPDTHWQVIANSKKALTIPLTDEKALEILQIKDSDDMLLDFGPMAKDLALLHQFEDTAPISTFVFGLMAGRFKCFVDDSFKEVPMRIFATQSRAQYLDAEEMFRVTQAGIAFYEEFFGVKFPFSKYDQIFCPEMRIVAMENVGAVTFDEIFLVPQEEKSEYQKFRLAYLILHELAHSWFGNLVTMKWWNDLWLKESFADYMGVTCMMESPELKNYKEPEQIFVRYLHLAMKQDIKSTTHPIYANVKHTTDAVNVFDCICYDKGASWIKLTNNFIGRQAFLNGCREYFKRFKFQTTELKDFIFCLSIGLSKTGSNFDLRHWTENWLTKSGVNELEPVIVKNSYDNSFTIDIKQRPSKHADQVYHDQKLDVGLYFEDGSEVFLLDVRVRAQETTEKVHQASLDKLPKAIFINANNKGYCRVVFDDQSQFYFLQNLSKIENNVNRTYLWKALYDQIKLFRLKPQDFLACVFEHFVHEEVELILPSILQDTWFILKHYFTHSDRRPLLLKYHDVLLDKLNRCTQASQKATLAAALLDHAVSLEHHSEKLLEWLDLNKIVNYAENNEVLFQLTKPHRYKIIRQMHASSKHQPLEKEQRLKIEREIGEFSNKDVLLSLECEGAINDTEAKEKLWDQYVKGSLIQKQFESSSRYFYNIEDEAQCMHFGEKFFQVIEHIFATFHRDYAEAFFHHLSPTFLGREMYLDKYIAILERAVKTENTHFRDLLKEEIELIEEIIQIRALQTSKF